MTSFKKKAVAVLMAATMGLTAFPVTSFAQNAFMTESVTVEYTAKVSKPTYKIKGTPGKRKIKLSCTTKNADIYYTTDGSTPTSSSKKYGGGYITVSKKTKIKAVAYVGASKSSVMTKTVKVTTLLGDVTGDGTISETDYTRLKSYLNGKTTYVCKDNCDMDGSGGIGKKDLNLLRDYLDEDREDSDHEVSASLEKPGLTIYKIYGGYKFKATTDIKGAKLYYTTNGNTPDKYDKEYTNKMVEVNDDCTIKVVAYKDGEYSDVKSRAVTLGDCREPYSDKSTDEEYQDSVKIRLDCDTSGARILYTTNGMNPVDYGTVYSGPIELTEDTTLKIVAQKKGCKNSKVVTYKYKVKSSTYSISGRVWDDTSSGSADGKYYTGEPGINGITVYLLNVATNSYEQTVTTQTINGIPGCYELTKAKPNTEYKVVFQFNGQKYRPFGSVVQGGNQALLNGAPPELIIRYDGAYTTDNKKLIGANSYNAAVSSNYYNDTFATTVSSYRNTADNVNLALRSNIYGSIDISFVNSTVKSYETGAETTATEGHKVYSNDVITSVLRVTNKSDTFTLKSSKVTFYLDSHLQLVGVTDASGVAAAYSLQGTNTNFNMTKYVISCPEIAPGKYVDFIVKTEVLKGVKNGVSVVSYAEISEYSYSESCYDRNSTPGNFAGYCREADEAATVKFLGYESLTDSQTISWAAGNDTVTPIPVGTARAFKFNIKNGIDASDYVVSVLTPGIISYETFCKKTASGTECTLLVTGLAPGSTNVVISLKRDAEKSIATTITVA